jgi:hypothetical protein
MDMQTTLVHESASSTTTTLRCVPVESRALEAELLRDRFGRAQRSGLAERIHRARCS